MSDQSLMRKPEFDVIVTMGIVPAPNRLAMVERPDIDYDCEDDDDHHHDNHEHDDDDDGGGEYVDKTIHC